MQHGSDLNPENTMSPRPRRLILVASLILTALTAACDLMTGPVLTACDMDALGVVDNNCHN